MCLPCRRRRITIRKTHLTSSAISLSHAACDLLPSDDAISTTPSNVVAESARSLFTVTPHPIGRLQLSALCKACIASSSYSPCQILPSSLKMQKKIFLGSSMLKVCDIATQHTHDLYICNKIIDLDLVKPWLVMPSLHRTGPAWQYKRLSERTKQENSNLKRVKA